MFGWNTWSVIGGTVAMVLHRYPYDNLFLPFHTWKKHYTHVPMTNHCNYAIMRNAFSHTTISPILPWQITSTMPLMTNHFTSSIPENHGSYSTTTNHFTHSIDDISFIRNWKGISPTLCVSAEERHFPVSAFLAMVEIMSLLIRQSFALNFPKNNTTLHLVKSISVSTASGSTHVVVVWFTWLAICFLVCFQPLKELSLICLIFPLKPQPWRELHVAVTIWHISCTLR